MLLNPYCHSCRKWKDRWGAKLKVYQLKIIAVALRAGKAAGNIKGNPGSTRIIGVRSKIRAYVARIPGWQLNDACWERVSEGLTERWSSKEKSAPVEQSDTGPDQESDVLLNKAHPPAQWAGSRKRQSTEYKFIRAAESNGRSTKLTERVRPISAQILDWQWNFMSKRK